MPAVITDRFTSEMTEPFVVFLVGMRVNKPMLIPKWTWTAMQMGKMLPDLYQHPQKGFLGGESFFRMFPLTTLLLSYWRSFEDLERFARAKDDLHLPVWREFYKRIGTSGDVGIWHETYMIDPGKYEAVYSNMPLFGLSKVTQNPIPLKGYRNKARARIANQDVQLAPELEIELHD